MAEAGTPAPLPRDVSRDFGRELFGRPSLSPRPEIAGAMTAYRDGRAQAALLELAEPKAVPHDAKDVKNGLLKRYSSKRDKDGKREDPTDIQEMRRLREARVKTEQYRSFLETGIIPPEMRGEIRSFLERSSVAFRDATRGMSSTNIDALIDTQIINDPMFRTKLLEFYAKRADPSQVLKKEKDVHELELTLSKLKSKLVGEVTSSEIDAAKIEVNRAETRLNVTGANLTEIAGYQSDFNELSSKIGEATAVESTLRTTFGALKAQIDMYETRLTSGTPAPGSQDHKRLIDTVNLLKSNPDYVEYQKAKLIVERFEKAKVYLGALTLPQKTALRELSDAQTKLADLKERAGKTMSPSDKADLEAQIRNTQVELADAKDALQAEMIEDYRSVTHMAQDAVQQILAEDLKKLPELYREQVDKKKTKEEEMLRSVTEKLPKAWKESRFRRGVLSMVTNRARASQWVNDWAQLGDEGVKNRMLSLSVPDLTAVGLTPEEITLFRETLTDPTKAKTFLAENADAIASQALADFFTSGGRFGKAEVQAITSSEKGRQLIAKAMESVEAQRAARNQLTGKGILRGKENIIGGRPIGERINKAPGRLGLAMMLLLFGMAAFKGQH